MRRRRSLIAKVVLTIPALWFLGVVLMNYNDSESSDGHSGVHKRQADQDKHGMNPIAPQDFIGDNGHNERLHVVDRGVLAQKIHEDFGGNGKLLQEEEEKVPTPKPERVKKVEEKPLKFKHKEIIRHPVDPNAPGM